MPKAISTAVNGLRLMLVSISLLAARTWVCASSAALAILFLASFDRISGHLCRMLHQQANRFRQVRDILAQGGKILREIRYRAFSIFGHGSLQYGTARAIDDDFDGAR